jgi:hypothetical protein
MISLSLGLHSYLRQYTFRGIFFGLGDFGCLWEVVEVPWEGVEIVAEGILRIFCPVEPALSKNILRVRLCTRLLRFIDSDRFQRTGKTPEEWS